MTRDEALARLTTDPEFAGRLAGDPSSVAADFGLSAEDVAFLQGLAPEDASSGPEQLGQRLSRSSLSFGSAVSHLLQGGHDSAHAAVSEQQHQASPVSPLSEGHDRSGPDLPQQDGPDLPQHGSQGSGSETPFRTGGSGGGVLPTGQSGDDAPTADVSVHHDDHRFHSDGRAGYNPQTDSSDDAGDKNNVQPSTTTSTSAHGDTTQTRVEADGTRVYTVMRADGSGEQEVDHPDGSTDNLHTGRDGSVTITHHTWDGLIKGDIEIYGPSHQHGDGGPDGGTESSGPAVDPAWASQQHGGAPSGDPETSQEHGGPTLDPTAANKVETGGSGTGGEGGVEAGPNPGLKPGEASAVHVSDNPTGYGTASYGKVDPNPVEH